LQLKKGAFYVEMLRALEQIFQGLARHAKLLQYKQGDEFLAHMSSLTQTCEEKVLGSRTIASFFKLAE
jgi:hypothetical protein